MSFRKTSFVFLQVFEEKPHNNDSKIKPPLPPRPEWSRLRTKVNTIRASRFDFNNYMVYFVMSQKKVGLI